jgi:hypothetical protein
MTKALGHRDRFAGNGTFTPASPDGYRNSPARTDTPLMEITGRLLFIAAVTCYLLGRVFSAEASNPETVVYGITAAFGLEFLIANWRALWAPS